MTWGLSRYLPIYPVLAEVPTVPERVRAAYSAGKGQVVALFG